MGEKTLPGLFWGYEQQAGGGWSGDVLIVDWDELDDATATGNVHVKRFKAAEVWPHKYQGKFRFPLAEGELDQPGMRAAQVRKVKVQKRRNQEIK